MDMTKGAENPNKQKHEKPHNKLLCATVCQEKKEVGEWNDRQERKKQSKSNEEEQNKTLKKQKSKRHYLPDIPENFIRGQRRSITKEF